MKYYTTFSISHFICCLFMILKLNFSWNMFIYTSLPIVLLLFCLIPFSKKMKSILIVGSYIALVISFALFWSNKNVMSLVVFNSYSLTAIIYLILTIVFVIILPKTEINSLIGIRIPVLMDDPQAWHKCQKIGSLIMSITIIPQSLLIFHCPNMRFLLVNLLLVGSCLISTILSSFIGTHMAKAKEQQEKEELKKQIQKEQWGKW